MNRRFDAAEFARLDALLGQCLDLDAPARARWFEDLHTRSPSDAQRLYAMLAAGERNEAVTLDAGLWADLAGDPARGQRFGAWRVIGTLAHGGMASVLLAERADDAFDVRVAIKCLWPGLVAPALVARLEQERQILAQLDDPRIARLLDGGVREDGVPWLALEFVDGHAIDAHCDAAMLDLDARVVLWLDVAAAVSVAHRQLVVHRDLKPANVLVSTSGCVKLLDFGIAKLLDPGAFTHAAPPTQAEARALTRDYASPEQIRGEQVTTASDVYQLGLMLYELLAGSQPFRAGPAHRRESRVLEFDPPPPSVAVITGEGVERRALTRAATPRRLARLLAGDLDAIVLHAMAKEPMARYASVEAMREDVERWRQGMPVRARRIGAARRTFKWLRRHVSLVVPVIAVLVLVALYALTTLMQARAIAREAAVNRAVRDYVIGWFQQADPGGTGRDPTASQMLVDGAARARAELSTDAALRAEILSVIARVRIARGEYAIAEPLLAEVEAIAAEAPGLQLASWERADQSRALLLHFTGRYAEAEAAYRILLRERLDEAGTTQGAHLVLRQEFADLLHSRGRYQEAIEQLERARADALKAPQVDRGLVANIGRNLADVYRDIGRQTDAEALYREVLVTQRAVHEPVHVNIAVAELGLGRLLLDEGRYAEAGAIILPTFERYDRVKGARTSIATYLGRYVAEVDEVRGDLAAAERRLADSAARVAIDLPALHIMPGYFALDRGWIALAEARDAEAAFHFASAWRVFAHLTADGHPRRIEIVLGEALLARTRGDWPLAWSLLADARAQARRDLAATHPLFVAIDVAESGTCDGTQASRGMAVLRVCRAIGMPASMP